MDQSKKLRQGRYYADDFDLSEKILNKPCSSWWYDCRGVQIPDKAVVAYSISNNGSDAETGMIRELNEISEGVVRVTVCVRTNTLNGLFIKLYDREKNDILYTCCGENKIIFTCDKRSETLKTDSEAICFENLRFEFVLDFDNCLATFMFYENTVSVPIKPGASISFIKIGTLPKSKIDVAVKNVCISADYAVNDCFKFYNDGEIPRFWQNVGAHNVCVYSKNLLIENGSAIRSFGKIGGRICLEFMMYTDHATDDCFVGFCSDSAQILEIFKQSSVFLVNNVTLKNAHDHMWYRIRAEIDADKGTAVIKINGKAVGSCNFICSNGYIDSIVFSAFGCRLLVDKVLLYNLEELDDYCPKPIIPNKKDGHIIGINVCSLWHSRYHVGWDFISPYDEIKPALGYYDEGIPEVADWEIKFLAENGVDFQMFCWYAADSSVPMKDTMHSYALHDGYMNAKYSNFCKFAILWEAANGVHIKSSKDFRENVVPYLIEHFFSDSRYMKIGNSPLMAIFGAEQLIRDFGGASQLKCQLDYLREQIKKLGYDNLIILNCGYCSEELARCGFDGSYQYGWGKNGCDADFTVSAIKAQKENDKISAVATVSTGFNNVGWACTRSENISAEDFKRVHLALRDEILPSFDGGPEWTKKLVMLSNWNEYGEGTYIMPCEKLCGFGYLEAVRDVYCKCDTDTNIFPSENVKKRLGYMYPQSRKAIQQHGFQKPYEPDNVVASFTFGNGDCKDLYNAKDTTLELDENGVISGKTSGGDPCLILNKDIRIDLTGVTHIRLFGKTSLPVYVEFFYLTEGMSDFAQRCSVNVLMSPENRYGCSLIAHKIPENTIITGLRIDPANMSGVEFEYSKTELLSNPELIYRIIINGYTEIMSLPFMLVEDEPYLPFNPRQDYIYRFGFYYEYRDENKKLSLISKDKTVEFTIGSRIVSECGKSVKLKTDIWLFDGIPMLPIDYLSNVFNFKYNINGSKLIIEKE